MTFFDLDGVIPPKCRQDAKHTTPQVSEPVTWGACQGRTNARTRRERAEERAATGLLKFLEGHAGNRKVRVEIGSSWIAHQSSDTTERCRWIRTVQRAERGTALQRENSTCLPAAQEAAEGACLATLKGKLVNDCEGRTS
jgi:hypothetical protein